MLRDSDRTVFCWAMGLTQHRNGVATIKEIANLAFAQGNLGKPGAGLFPVRGHSNVQGDRTMGIWERPPAHFLDALEKEFDFDPPRDHGIDVVDSIRGMRDGTVKVFVGLGGNFVQATPDTDVTVEALRRTRLSVQVSTKLNRSHLVTGDTALILPTLGPHRQGQAGRRRADDHRGGLGLRRARLPGPPRRRPAPTCVRRSPSSRASPRPRSGTVTGCSGAPCATTTASSATTSRAWCPGARTTTRGPTSPAASCSPTGRATPGPSTPSRARASSPSPPSSCSTCPTRHLVLQTLRSHDQFNTTIYGLSDRYRGIEGGRRVVFAHKEDIAALGFQPGDMVDLVSHWADDDIVRCAPSFRIVEFDTPRGTAAAYYPETNPLVPLDNTALHSNTPVYKAVIVTLVPEGTGLDTDGQGSQDSRGSDSGHRARPDPTHLS